MDKFALEKEMIRKASGLLGVVNLCLVNKGCGRCYRPFYLYEQSDDIKLCPDCYKKERDEKREKEQHTLHLGILSKAKVIDLEIKWDVISPHITGIVLGLENGEEVLVLCKHHVRSSLEEIGSYGYRTR